MPASTYRHDRVFCNQQKLRDKTDQLNDFSLTPVKGLLETARQKANDTGTRVVDARQSAAIHNFPGSVAAKTGAGPMSVSLVIPSYNRGSLIGQTIRSALAQTVPFAEIIVADDGSSDNTIEVLRSFGGQIRVLQLAHGGVQQARNAGAAAATSNYCTFCDSDDLLEPQFVEKALLCLQMHPETDAFYCNFVTFSNDGRHSDKFSGAPRGFFDGATISGEFATDIPDLYVRTVGYQALFMSGCLVRTDFFHSLKGFDTAFNGVGGEDWEFTLRVLASGKVAVCTTVLAMIRKHTGNTSGDAIRQVMGTANILEHALSAHPAAARYRSVIAESIDHRRRLVFQEAFARGKFDLAFDMLALIGRRRSGLKFSLKILIMRLPAPLRHQAWRLTQL